MSERVYFPLDDPEMRAGVVAHFIRMRGEAPPVGQWIGLSLQMKEVEAASVDEAVSHIDQATPAGEKQWCELTVTEEDVKRGLELVRSERLAGHPGKKSSFPLPTEGGSR